MRRNYSGMTSEREVVRDVSRESLSRDKDIRSDPRVRDRDRLLPRYSIDRRRFEAEEPEWFSGKVSNQTIFFFFTFNLAHYLFNGYMGSKLMI